MAYGDQQQMQIYAPQQVASQFKSRYKRDFNQQDIDQFKQASGWSGEGDITQEQVNRGAAAFDRQYGYQQSGQQGGEQSQQPQGGFTDYLQQFRDRGFQGPQQQPGSQQFSTNLGPSAQTGGQFPGARGWQPGSQQMDLQGSPGGLVAQSAQPQQQQAPTRESTESYQEPRDVQGFQNWAQSQFGQQATPEQLQQIAQAAGITDPNNITPEQMQRAQQVTQQYANQQRQAYQQQQQSQQQQQTQQPAQQAQPAAQPAAIGQFQNWMQLTYGSGATPEQLQQVAQAAGITDPNNVTPEQMQRAQAAMGQLQQQRGNLGTMPFPTLPNQPGPAQSFQTSVQQGRDLISPYQASAQNQQLQTQAGQYAQNMMNQQAMQYQTPAGQQQNYNQQQDFINRMGGMQAGAFNAPTGGPTPDFTQQQNLINQMQQVQGPQSNQALFNQQQQSINAMQGIQAGPFQAQGGQLMGQAAGAAAGMMNAGPLVGQFQAPEQIAQAERNRTLQAIMGSPDVFGQQQQAQMAEQQKEQLVAQQREAEGRLSQMMAQRGLSGRGGAELAGQMGLQENLISGLMAGQRDIALRSAEANRAARLNAVSAVTGAQQADLGMATQAYQTGLQGAQANRAAQESATQLGAQIAGQQFGQGLQGYQAGLQGQQLNLAAQQAAAQAAGQLGSQQFQQGLQGAEFTRAGQQAALAGSQNLANQQMALNQQNFGQALSGYQANLQGQQFNLGAAQAAQQAAAGLGAQQFAQGLAGQQFNLQAQGQQQQAGLNAAQLANQMGQQGFQNYLAQQNLGLQGIGLAEQGAMARTQNEQQNFLNILNAIYQGRGQEQNYGLNLQRLGLEQQQLAGRMGGF